MKLPELLLLSSFSLNGKGGETVSSCDEVFARNDFLSSTSFSHFSSLQLNKNYTNYF